MNKSSTFLVSLFVPVFVPVFVSVLLSVLLLGMPLPSYATLRAVESIEWKTLHADAIVIGRVLETKPLKSEDCYMCSDITIAVSDVLKGQSPAHLECLLKAWPQELAGQWKQNQHTLLLFLSREPSGWVIANSKDGAIDLDNLSSELVVSKKGIGIFDKEAVIKEIKSALHTANAEKRAPTSKTIIMNLTLTDHGKQIMLPKGNQASLVVPEE